MSPNRQPAWLIGLTLPALLLMACGATPRNSTRADTPPTVGPHAAAWDMTAVSPLAVTPDFWRDKVSPEARRVLFEDGTERAFTSPLNDEHRAGTFVCAACYLPVFSSKSKFDSGTGWPSFFEPIPGRLGLRQDTKMIVPRTEYHCVRCGGHMGHLFDDGPPPTGQRWCNNGVSLRFVPGEEELPELRGADAARFQLSRAPKSKHSGMAMLPADQPNQDVAILAGGCFWCMELPFEKIPGVYAVVSGYTGGHMDDPTYEMSNTHTTGHIEAIWVAFDSTKVSYADLLKVYWRNVDPTTDDRQFCDWGDTYRAAIFPRSTRQQALAEASRDWAATKLKVSGPIVTTISPAGTFWPAEEYHQDYHRKNPVHYFGYRLGCGRDARLKELWGEDAAH
ncbi:MAG: peptide-methionine (S)-S-oxide reductase MsrA [Candidatus Eisenbacteria bacterium]|nr:peptide-methionine (S)-S-oxide reductase MsrA [Candidatus Eisenbacteria bacterium]